MAQVRLQAIVFDLYETLVTEFDPAWRPKETPAERLGVRGDIFDRVWRSRKAARMTRAVDYRDVMRQACQTAGLVIDADVETVIADLYRERLEAKARPLLEAEQPVLDSLRQLKASGLKLGLISNCSVEEVAAWNESPLASFFDDVTFSYRVGYAKPDRAIYLMACHGLQLSPEQCAFVGDGGSDELVGAARVGMSPYCARWFVDRWPTWRRHRADESGPTFPHLSSLADLATLQPTP